MKKPFTEELTLEKIVGGGQAMGVLADGRKAFVWGGLPGEKVAAEFRTQKKNYVDGTVITVVTPSDKRVAPADPDSYLSTSPWQIMDFDSEQHYKSALIEEAFELHDIVLPTSIGVFTDGRQYGYRNKVEFSWWWDNDTDQLDLAFFRRGTHGKIPVQSTSLAVDVLNTTARQVRDILRARKIEARQLKTLLIRANQSGTCVFQLYVTEKEFIPFTREETSQFTSTSGWEIIYSDPRSPASVITKRLYKDGEIFLTDTVLGSAFRYAPESFFQGNIPVYEKTLEDMKQYIPSGPVVDMYSGVGSIGFTIGGDQLTLVELNKSAIGEMKKNRYQLGKKATIIEASAESSLAEIVSEATIILDPPRAGLHESVVDRLLEVKPARILYLSCNPVTQARDIKYLAASYGVKAHQGYNFFPRTPHIEHLVVLELMTS